MKTTKPPASESPASGTLTPTGVKRPRAHMRRREMHKWSVKETENWVANVLKMPSVAAGVSRERVDGRMAIEMAPEDWGEVGASVAQSAQLAAAARDVVGLGGLTKAEMGW
jgi:hypothetical protein